MRKITLVTYKIMDVLVTDKHRVSVKVESFEDFEVIDDTYWFLQELDGVWDFDNNLYLFYNNLNDLLERIDELKECGYEKKILRTMKKEIKKLYKKSEKADGCYIVFN